MSIIKYLIVLLILSFVCSCVHTEEITEATAIELKLMQNGDCADVQISLEYGRAERLEDCLYKLSFNRARWGKTILFGKVIKNRDPQYTNKVEVNVKGNKILETNFIKITSLQTEEIGNR